MLINFKIKSKNYTAKLNEPIDLSWPLYFGKEETEQIAEQLKNPSAFFLPDAGYESIKAGDFIGDVTKGGAVNCGTLHLCTHGNGTHTECVGHITASSQTVNDCLAGEMLLALKIDMEAKVLDESKEQYLGQHDPKDRILTLDGMSKSESLKTNVNIEEFGALIINCKNLENSLVDTNTGKILNFSGSNPPFLSHELITWISQQNFKHLLVNLPSIDRENDGGTTPNHHTFFEVIEGHELESKNYPLKTVTEMLKIPEHLEDGMYLLSLQIPNFVHESAPSRPVVFKIKADS